MTPELKIACEVVFQEHKSSSQIKWDKDAFRGRISIGLSEMAKETLVQQNIIILPNKAKKIITLLNPDVASASSFEEAVRIIVNKIPALATSKTYDHSTYLANHVYGFEIRPSEYTQYQLQTDNNSESAVTTIKWYLKPFFCYVVWPVCAIVAGALVTFLIDLAQTKLFLDLK